MIRILKFLKPYRWGVILVFTLVALRAVLDLFLPLILGRLINEGVGLSDLVDEPNIQRIYELAGVMLVIILIGIGVTILSSYMESKISSSFAVDLRNAVYQKIETFSLREMDHFTTSSLITRSTNDIQQIQGFINFMLRLIILQPVLAFGAIVFSVRTQPNLSMILIASVTAIIFFIVIIFSITLPKFQLIQKLVDRLNRVTRENLGGLRVVRAFNTQAFQAKRIDDASKEVMSINIFVNRVSGLLWPLMALIMGFTSLAIVYFGAQYIERGVPGFEPGDLIALMQYAMRAVLAFMFMTIIFIMIPRAAISANRIMEVLDMDVMINDPKQEAELPSTFKGEITFHDVSFKYPNADQPVLDHISFTAKAHETTAFIGSTGSGKSTLINLIPRFYDITEGKITIDGIDIRDLKQDTLHGLMGYVPQRGVLFTGSIKDNILFGAEQIEEDYMREAARIAQADEFINEMEQGFESPIAQGGKNVSGGQRQRLSIARAISKKPTIFIFDDSFSALDYKTDRNLRKMLTEKVNATKLIVAQRINTIRHAEQIIVLDQGKIVGQGTHDELMKTCSVYQEIASSQLSKEEL